MGSTFPAPAPAGDRTPATAVRSSATLGDIAARTVNLTLQQEVGKRPRSGAFCNFERFFRPTQIHEQIGQGVKHRLPRVHESDLRLIAGDVRPQVVDDGSARPQLGDGFIRSLERAQRFRAIHPDEVLDLAARRLRQDERRIESLQRPRRLTFPQVNAREGAKG